MDHILQFVFLKTTSSVRRERKREKKIEEGEGRLMIVSKVRWRDELNKIVFH